MDRKQEIQSAMRETHTTCSLEKVLVLRFATNASHKAVTHCNYQIGQLSDLTICHCAQT